MDMKFSVVIQSYLGIYNGAAKNREKKFNAALDSLMLQTYQDFEVVIVSDGCQQTVEIIEERADDFNNIVGLWVDKQKIWSGLPRNTGIDYSNGEYVIYLDTDDFYGEKYLESLAESIRRDPAEWYHFDDFIWDKSKSQWKLRKCNIDVYGMCGTSNICHKRTIGAYWPLIGNYKHDWHFINTLKSLATGKRLELAGYFVGHIPGKYDV